MEENNAIGRVLLFIPARNEEAEIGTVINESAKEIAASLETKPDVLVVDDGSADRTAELAQKNGAQVIRFNEGVGLGNAFGEAVRYAIDKNYDLMITTDGDGQFSPNDIPKLIEPILRNEADFVTGSRFLPESKLSGIPTAKQIGNNLMSRLISSILGKRYCDVSCGFRAYSREALLRLNLFGGFTYTQEVFLNLGYKRLRIREVPIRVQYFTGRKSRIAGSLFRYGFHTARIIFKSVVFYRPMRLFGSIAFILFIAGFPTALALSVRYALTDLISPFKGFAILSVIMVAMSFVSFIIGLVLESISKLQLSIDKQLYYGRKYK